MRKTEISRRVVGFLTPRLANDVVERRAPKVRLAEVWINRIVAKLAHPAVAFIDGSANLRRHPEASAARLASLATAGARAISGLQLVDERKTVTAPQAWTLDKKTRPRLWWPTVKRRMGSRKIGARSRRPDVNDRCSGSAMLTRLRVSTRPGAIPLLGITTDTQLPTTDASPTMIKRLSAAPAIGAPAWVVATNPRTRPLLLTQPAHKALNRASNIVHVGTPSRCRPSPRLLTQCGGTDTESLLHPAPHHARCTVMDGYQNP